MVLLYYIRIKTLSVILNNNNEAEVITVNENRIEVRTKKFNGSKSKNKLHL